MKNLNQFAKFISAQVLLAVIGISCFAQSYELDPSFNVGIGFSTHIDSATLRLKIQSDNKILVSGRFHSYNGTIANSIVRLNLDGSIDTTFITGTAFGSNANVNCLELQTDGKIIAAGYFDEYNNVIAKGIVRLHQNGTLDTTFNYNGSGFNYPGVSDVFLHDDGKTIAVGPFHGYNGNIARKIVRLNSDGSNDASFNTNLGFCDNSDVIEIDYYNGKYLVSGWIETFNDDSVFNVVLLNYDGSIDTDFNSGLTSNFYLFSKFTSDGKILIFGVFSEYDGQTLNNFIRLNQDGTVDPTFNAQWFNSIYPEQVFISEEGKLWCIGEYLSSGNSRWLNRINEDGSQDPTFDADAYFGDKIPIDVEFLNDGKLLICGTISTFNGTPVNGIVRLQSILSVDTNPNIDKKLTIYPNPATSTVNISSKNISKSEIQLFDASGRRINCNYMVLNDNNLILNTEMLSNGIYTLSVVDETSQNVKIFIQK